MNAPKGMKLVSVVRFMPERVVTPEDMMSGQSLPEELKGNPFFHPPRERRFASPQYSSADLGERALKRLIEQTGISPSKIDLILYTCNLTDTLILGIGPDIQQRCGATNAAIIQVDNGCVSFITMLNMARAFIEAGRYKTIAIVAVTNFISRLQEFQQSPRSAVLGDGAAAALAVPGESSFLSIYEKAHGENHGLMRAGSWKDDTLQDYWAAGNGPIEIRVNSLERLKANAMQLVPSAVKHALHEAGMTTSDVSWLLTHQPNVRFMERWREEIGITAPRVFDTFHQYGNLFHSTLPVTLAEMLERSMLRDKDTVAMGTFSHGGDFSAAAVLRWRT